MELAGSLGDLGTLLPIAIAMVLFNGLNPLGLFLSIGIFYIASGMYFGVTVPVQPMKVIGAYAIATAMSPEDYFVATLILGITLASNLAAGFIAGMIVAQLLRWKKLSV